MADFNQPAPFGAYDGGAPEPPHGGAPEGVPAGTVTPIAPDEFAKKRASRKRGKAVYPTKTSINLVRQDKARKSVLTQVALFVVVVALIGVFGKFAVVDPLAESFASSADVTAAQAQLDQLVAANANYAELDEKYARYIVTGLTDEELNLASRNELLDLIQANLMQVGYLSSLKVTGNVVSATSLGADLTQVSKLVETLEGDSRVAHVTVSTAQGKDNEGTSATIEVTMKGALDVAGDILDEALGTGANMGASGEAAANANAGAAGGGATTGAAAGAAAAPTDAGTAGKEAGNGAA